MQMIARDHYIAAMRNVANSVSVVTTSGKAGQHGATVSAFCSVSADPPTVLACLNEASRIARMVQANGTFHINVLPENAARLADRFAGHHDDTVSDRFDGITLSSSGPCISGATIFSCHLKRAFREGSHLVCIGTVNDVSIGSCDPLTWLAGGYRSISNKKICPQEAF